MHPTLQGSFDGTLSLRERRLGSRLEGFGDIVFGFAVSQCALQLPTDRGHVDLSQPLALALYFATFALIASLWIVFHRLMSSTFIPAGVDLIGAFAYLALVSLIPFAMYGISHETAGLAAARAALAQYEILYGATMLIAAILTFRNIRRGWEFGDLVERDRVWLGFLRRSIVAVQMLIAVPIDLALGPTPASLSLITIYPVIRLARKYFAHAPQALAPQRVTPRER